MKIAVSTRQAGPTLLLTLLALALLGCGSLLAQPDKEPIGSREQSDKNRTSYSHDFDGISVKFLGIGSSWTGQTSPENSMNDSMWSPDGSPFLGVDLRHVHWLGSGSVASDKDVRFLLFELEADAEEDIDIYGFIKGTKWQDALDDQRKYQLSTFDRPKNIQLRGQWLNRYRTEISAGELRKGTYVLGIARGEWEHLHTTTDLPEKALTGDIEKHDWGTLRIVRQESSQGIRFNPAVLTFRVDPPSMQHEQSYRLRVLDKDGNDFRTEKRTFPWRVWVADSYSVSILASDLGNVGAIEIESRPYEFFEFKNVQLDPDLAEWGESHWGDEGNSTVQTGDGGVELHGLAHVYQADDKTGFSELFASDAVRWRDYPGNRYTVPSWFDPDGKSMFALVRTDEKATELGDYVKVQIFASDSSVPGEGIGERISSEAPRQLRRKFNQVRFTPPTTNYVQLAVQLPEDEWEFVGSASPPTVRLQQLTPKQVSQIKSGIGVGVSPFHIVIRESGSLGFFYMPEDSDKPGNTQEFDLIKWNPEDRDVRLIAKMKSGKRIVLHNNSAGDGTGGKRIGFNFFLDIHSNPVLKMRDSQVFLKDIKAFELETRTYKEPYYLVAKMPRKRLAD